MISDDDFDALRRVADDIRRHADNSYYGYFAGGDPRGFSPDPETCSADELESHRVACEAWERGECADIGGPHQPLTAEDIESIKATTGREVSGGHKTIAHYGLGVQSYDDAALIKLAQDLDDWIDRARQVTP